MSGPEQQLTPDELAAELATNPARAFKRLENATAPQPIALRRRLAMYLTEVASDLMRDLPHAHVRIENGGGHPPFVCVSITRQQRENDAYNDEPSRTHVFNPPYTGA